MAVKVTKSRKSRRVPVADRILAMVRRMAASREADAPLFVTTRGISCMRARSNGRWTGPWSVRVDGFTICGTWAGCLWLARGVDPVTVQAWMGHASIATTEPVSASPGNGL